MRHKRVIEDRSILRMQGHKSVATLVAWRDDPTVPWPQRVECALELVRQAYGRAPQRSEVETQAALSLKISVEEIASAMPAVKEITTEPSIETIPYLQIEEAI